MRHFSSLVINIYWLVLPLLCVTDGDTHYYTTYDALTSTLIIYSIKLCTINITTEVLDLGLYIMQVSGPHFQVS